MCRIPCVSVPAFFSGCHAVNKEDQLPAAAVARMLRTLLFGVSPLDPLSFATVPFILAAASALASLLPASRVAGINPVDAAEGRVIAAVRTFILVRAACLLQEERSVYKCSLVRLTDVNRPTHSLRTTTAKSSVQSREICLYRLELCPRMAEV
jgi:hypothetical protein